MFHVMGIRELEDRSLNREVHDVETKFEAMVLARKYRAEGLDVVILDDERKKTYASSIYWMYLFYDIPEVAVKKIDKYVSVYTTPGGDVGTLWDIDLSSPRHLYDLLQQLYEVEQMGRETECVPVYNRASYVRTKLLGGYLQYHGLPIGTAYSFAAADLVDWFNEVFADYVVFDGLQAVVVG
jgi:hypothetical protein